MHQLCSDECSLNNGVLVYDLKKWREGDYADRLFAWSTRNSVHQLYKLGSQPPFNLVFYRNYKILDDRYNIMDIAGLKDVYRDERVPWTRWPENVQNAVVLQYVLIQLCRNTGTHTSDHSWNGVMKPWMCDRGVNYSELWYK